MASRLGCASGERQEGKREGRTLSVSTRLPMHQSLSPVSGKLCKSSWVSWTADGDRVLCSVTTHANLCRVTSCLPMRTFSVSQKSFRLTVMERVESLEKKNDERMTFLHRQSGAVSCLERRVWRRKATRT